MRKSVLDVLVGLAVIIVATIFVAFVYHNSVSNYQSQRETYKVKVKFQDIMGIIEGSDVAIAGIKVGNVSKVGLDPDTYEALVFLEINQKVKIPVDSKASIITSGLVGNKLISIDPGPSETFMKDGDQFLYSTSTLSLEALIGKFIYSMGNKSSTQ